MVKAMAALALLGALWSAVASAACMQDRWGQVICGAVHEGPGRRGVLRPDAVRVGGENE